MNSLLEKAIRVHEEESRKREDQIRVESREKLKLVLGEDYWKYTSELNKPGVFRIIDSNWNIQYSPLLNGFTLIHKDFNEHCGDNRFNAWAFNTFEGFATSIASVKQTWGL